MEVSIRCGQDHLDAASALEVRRQQLAVETGAWFATVADPRHLEVNVARPGLDRAGRDVPIVDHRTPTIREHGVVVAGQELGQFRLNGASD